MHFFVLMMLFLATGCYLNDDSIKAKQAYQKLCPESDRIPFEKLTSKSTCKGTNIIVAAFMNHEELKSIENKIGGLRHLFRDAKGFHDWEAMEKFREPHTGRTLPHIIGEYGTWEDHDRVFWEYSLLNQIMQTDANGENYLHKLVRNQRSPQIYLGSNCDRFEPGVTEPTSKSPRINRLVYQKNSFGQTPMDLAASLGDFNKVMNLYTCNPKPQEMAKIFAEYGAEFAFHGSLSLHPELYDYLIPFLFEKRESENVYFNNKVDRWSLFELHFFSPSFSAFISQQEEIFDRFMDDREIMERLVLNLRLEHNWHLDPYGQSMIYYFVSSDLTDSNFFKKILERTHLEKQNFRGETIFHVMSKRGKVKEMKEAIKRLTSTEILLIRDNQGRTALDVCKEKKNCDLLTKRTKN